MIGFYHSRMARKSRNEGIDAIEGHFREAARAYLQAAKYYPEDDEYHPCEFSVSTEDLGWFIIHATF